MRTLKRVGAVCALVSAAFLLAPAAHATPPGDNGTVKIHDASTGEELPRNEPHVCTFYLDAFGFDGLQKVDWHIDAIPPSENKGETVKSGAITLDDQGHGRTADLSLPDGHYKLYWNFEGEKGSAKHKVFWTDCEDSGEPGGATPSGSASPSASASASASEEPSGDPSGDPSASASEPAGGSGAASASPQGGADGDLAETGNGAPVGLLSGVAAALVAAGGYLVLRRSKARQD
ncbi:LPXTG cell wall anchor domain-containing protein [Streptomyces sp. NPDC052682]|uniref:LPXTG cell wall anchor domain-containing protein n=1 Tax=Streptomyces sp. NPDC052682 TaxID=3154954 RepID=UPI00344656FE